MDNIKIICDESGVRLDKYVKVDGLTRTQLQNLINSNNVTVNQNTVKQNQNLNVGDVIEITIPEPEVRNITAENIALDVLYEDSHVLVVNKPQGMVVHPAAGNHDGTLVNALMFHCGDSLSGINGVIRPGIVHRIDKDTSGLLVVAKTNAAHLSLAEQIKNKTVVRRYECVVNGIVKPNKGIIDAPIGRHPTERKMMTVTAENSRNAVTHFEVLERFNSHTHMSCRLETGRTHQIRAHMRYMGHTVLGDPLYSSGRNRFGIKQQVLHAKILGFVHPQTGKYMEFDSPLPSSFVEILDKLKTEME